MAHLTELWRYPVKSMIGESLQTSQLTLNGLLGDRGWATRDEVRGGIRGAKKIGSLMRLAARYLSEPTLTNPVPDVEITLPDGTIVRTSTDGLDAALSKALDHEVKLFSLQPVDALDHYRRGPADSEDFLEELRDIFGRELDEPLPDLSKFPPVVFEYETPPGSYFDAFPMLLMTKQSLQTIDADVRRFRPNFVIDTGESSAGLPENEWIGNTVRIGECELKVETECPRCVMVTRGFADMPEDRTVLRRVVKEANQNLGVYATVTKPGKISVGDEFSVV